MESRTILVVEDEALVAEDLRSRLVSLRFHVPTTVSEADEAVRLARELRPDLVLMDIMLHGNSDGIRAAETIWRELSIPIVFLTAYTDENTLRMAGATEPFGYLVKPFTDRELLTCLKMAFYKVEAERALRASEARLRTLVQLAPIAIAMTDGEGRTALWNRAAEGIMGYQEAEVTGRSLLSLLAGSPEMERAIVERVGAVGRVEGIGVSALTKGGASIDIELSASRLDDGAGGPGGMVVVWRDVTEQRRVHRQMMSRLLTYDVREGRIYLAKESSPAVSLRVFHELLSAGYKGTRLSRAVRAGRGAEAPAHDILRLSEKPLEGSIAPEPGAIERWFEGLAPNHVALLDRLDYILSRNGFEKTLLLVQNLGDIAFLRGHIAILSLDPSCFGDRELRLIEAEAEELRLRTAPVLDAGMRAVLRRIHDRNVVGEKPSLSTVGRELHLSRPTVRWRVRRLAERGFIRVAVSGRRKTLELTEQGWRFFTE